MTLAVMEADLAVISHFTSSASNTDILLLELILCIYYLILFEKNKTKIKTLIDFGNEINAMTPVYVSKLGF